MGVDGSRLWALISVPDPGWTPPRPGTRVEQSGLSLDNRFDAVVEVIDLTTGEVVASQRFDHAVFALLHDGNTLRLTADNLGVPLWQIQSLRLHARQQH